jgi:long-chain acyl-CoA synthetase
LYPKWYSGRRAGRAPYMGWLQRRAGGWDKGWMTNLIELSRLALDQDASKEAIEFEGQFYTWGDIRRVAHALAAVLEASGAAADAPIAFIPRSRPSALAALLGLTAAGRTIQMVYGFQSPAAITRDIEKLTPAAVLAAAEDFSQPLIALLRDRGIAGIALDGMSVHAIPSLEYSRWQRTSDALVDPRIELLTSGTTGPPKRFAATYAMIATHLVGNSNLSMANRSEGSATPPVMLYFPISNISGLYMTMPALLSGKRVLLLDRFSFDAWHQYVLKYRPEASGLPAACIQLVLDRKIPREDLASVRTMSTGAAPVDPTVQRAFEEHYGIPILLSYGATEFAGPVTYMTAELHAIWGEKKFGSVGRALPGAKLRVIDPVTGAEVAPGVEGLLEVVSPRIGPDWIRTSDLAVLDADGFLFVRGRADGAINRGGFKILPEIIERSLLLHPGILAAAVVALPDRRLGQVPCAAIQFKSGVEAPTPAEVEAHLRDYVPATHIPVEWRFVSDLPKTPSMKIDRPAVARLFDAG